MHILPHDHNKWIEKAGNPHDAWHIDLIGKFKHASLGGNSYIVTYIVTCIVTYIVTLLMRAPGLPCIDNCSRYSTVVPIKNKTSPHATPLGGVC